MSSCAPLLRVASCGTTIPQRIFRIRAPIRTPIEGGTRIKETRMTEQQDRVAQEREEIAARVASFKATQEKFQREREEYFVNTLANARSGFQRLPLWS
jgi:chorismate mutase